MWTKPSALIDLVHLLVLGKGRAEAHPRQFGEAEQMLEEKKKQKKKKKKISSRPVSQK